MIVVKRKKSPKLFKGPIHEFDRYYHYHTQGLNPLVMFASVIFLSLFASIISIKVLALTIGFSFFLLWNFLRVRALSYGLKIKRTYGRHLREEDTLTVHYEIINTSSFKLRDIVLVDEQNIEQGKNIVCNISVLAAHSKCNMRYDLKANSGMGHKQLGTAKLLIGDEWGLFIYEVQYKEVDSIVEVFPRVIEIPKLSFQADPYSLRMGTYHTHQRGQGVSFLGLRDYQRGDSIRHINWKRFARHERLLINEFEGHLQASISVICQMDRSCQAGQGAYSTWEYTKDLALAIAHQNLSLGNTLGVTTNEFSIPQGTGQAHFNFIELKLAACEPSVDNRPEELLEKSLIRLPAGTSVYYICSILNDKLWRAQLSTLTRAATNNISLRLVLIDPSHYMMNSLKGDSFQVANSLNERIRELRRTLEKELVRIGLPYAVVDIKEGHSYYQQILQSKSCKEKSL